MVRLGATLALLSVALGAFAAHGLESHLTPERLATFQTGVRYQMYHALAILALGLHATRSETRTFRRACLSFTIGITLFSGSLYVLCLTGWTILGAVTPIGGLAFMLGWIFVIFPGKATAHA